MTPQQKAVRLSQIADAGVSLTEKADRWTLTRGDRHVDILNEYLNDERGNAIEVALASLTSRGEGSSHDHVEPARDA